MDETPPAPEAAASPIVRWGSILLAVVLAGVVGASWLRPAPPAGTPAGGSEAFMQAGLDALYKRNDPTAAAAEFRKVLALNPTHYGATYQLATALDRAGKPDEARPLWEKMLPMAEAAHDDATLAAARARLGQAAPPAAAPDLEPAMKAGLDALYTRNDPAAAAVEFRKVLANNPTHYGATYQLATALDRAGRRAEARPLWEKVVTMAEGYKDQPTLATARARLAQKP
jgi:tetratricopeptide (TPR) repeat protein